ncbi:MAG: division/cell wall cluster transcriptional repressor MraZ [Gammaproteobacteria bacterium]|nr:division/cell wall cluster transcriptional repressor MraZ [Gammaproteobacteria bacterium]MCP5317660.1 division/cell wall cluster transcriptional repressor MraZ [Chromatiaceae bacterium]MCW5587086.1 division/cell wall cluster transcriptional repressor MraZ [Chromatiales bacterium]MCB1817246.1 division/cell wall cluster transcriptional repressor MraZ [Gammaproteobacteria bacterium]MCP5430840.1 division/cell wall cluster transcriptional repressor MraZ [Chromatiaceae bacterium]
MFLGVSTLNVDAKGRIAIPAKHRDAFDRACASRVVVTISPKERCLWLYPENEWVELARKLSRLPNMNPKNQAIQRLMLGHASELELDGQGRILISPELRDFAGLGKRVSLVGQVHKFEIWDAESWGGVRDASLETVASADGYFSDELEGMSL